MSEVIDIDVLAPKKVTIKFGEQMIEVAPPRVATVLKLGSLGQKLQAIEDLPVEEMEKLINDLIDIVTECIPQLEGKQLATAQLLKIIEIIGSMAVPPDVDELAKQGVTVGDPKVQ